MSDYPDFTPGASRPGYGTSLQDKVARNSNIAEEKLCNDITGSGVFLGLIVDVSGPVDELDYGIRINIDDFTYFYDNFEDIFLLCSGIGRGPGPRMSHYNPLGGRFCFDFFVTSSFSNSIQVYVENAAGIVCSFVSRLYYSLLEAP